MAILDTNAPVTHPPTTFPIGECPYCPASGAEVFRAQHIFSFWHLVCQECGRTVAWWGPGMKEWQVKGPVQIHDVKRPQEMDTQPAQIH